MRQHPSAGAISFPDLPQLFLRRISLRISEDPRSCEAFLFASFSFRRIAAEDLRKRKHGRARRGDAPRGNRAGPNVLRFDSEPRAGLSALNYDYRGLGYINAGNVRYTRVLRA